jgi:outer membrane lipoprotein
MRPKQIVNWLIAAGLVILCSGCAHVISSDIRARSRSDVYFSSVLSNPGAFAGETVIWGGRIIETVNHEGYTTVKILQMALDSYGRPQGENTSMGRFMGRIAGFVDDEIYHRGRLITVAGEITGSETERLGETTYTYPVVQVKETHLWQWPPYGYDDYPYWYDPYDPRWYFYPYFRHHFYF